jgi:rhamnulokinase
MGTYLGVDLGATSGRVSLGIVSPDGIDLHEVRRFRNTPVRVEDDWFWDVEELYGQILDGLAEGSRTAGAAGTHPNGIAVDTWGVDFGVVGPDGELIVAPRHYRSAGLQARHRVTSRITELEVFERTGVQPMTMNTVYQASERLAEADVTAGSTLLLVPDLVTYWLTGARAAERTIASTTGLVNAQSGRWDVDVVAGAGFDPALLPPLRDAATVAGTITPQVRARIGATSPIPVLHVGSHDTASAVAAVPLEEFAAFVSCGTWALAGVEHDSPVLSTDALAAGFTNEAGVGGRTLVMRNLTGLWLLEQCLHGWGDPSLPDLIARAVHISRNLFIDVGAADLVSSTDVPADILQACRRSGQADPADPAEYVRCILLSLALAYRRTIRRAAELTGRTVSVVHLVGGGSRNALLCQLTADACDLPVVAGPAEASSLGNVGVQAMATGELGSLDELRSHIAAGVTLRRFLPSESDPARWDRGEDLLTSTARL